MDAFLAPPTLLMIENNKNHFPLLIRSPNELRLLLSCIPFPNADCRMDVHLRIITCEKITRHCSQRRHPYPIKRDT